MLVLRILNLNQKLPTLEKNVSKPAVVHKNRRLLTKLKWRSVLKYYKLNSFDVLPFKRSSLLNNIGF